MKQYLFILYIAILLSGCSANEPTHTTEAPEAISFNIKHPSAAVTRATETDFEPGDCVGVFLTISGQPIAMAGNEATNMPLTYNGDTWTADHTLYWNDSQYDAYAYYPFTTPLASTTDMPFSVQTDQSTAEGYTASDFLWAQRKAVTAADGTIDLTFAHCMSRLMIRLVKGDSYEGELPEEAEVYIHNTFTDATIDLHAGVVTRNPHASRHTIHARKVGNHRYSAVVIPQRLDNRMPLVEVVSHGVSFLYESKFLFKPGIQHNVLLTLSNNPEQIKIEIGGEKENWND